MDEHISKEGKTRRKKLDVEWINYEKDYDIILYIWNIEYLKMFKISEKIINYIMKAIENW